MLENLSENVRECYRHAEDCERQASLQTDPALRQDFLDTAARWVKLARSYELSERLSRFTFKPNRIVVPSSRMRDGVFDDEITKIMGEAFDAACALLGDISKNQREAIADRIIDAATAGERDPNRLRDAGMAALRKQLR